MSAMSSCGFPEPPTRTSLEDARRVLDVQRTAVATVSARIHAAEEELARIVRERRDAIQEMEKERAAVEDQVSRTLAYLSHIRRLPHELLGQIFMFIFDDYPCCAWVLAAVCSLWRRQVLSMPRLWSKVSGSIALLKTMTGATLTGTPVVPFAGVTLTTVGFVRSMPVDEVVKDDVYGLAIGVP